MPLGKVPVASGTDRQRGGVAVVVVHRHQVRKAVSVDVARHHLSEIVEIGIGARESQRAWVGLRVEQYKDVASVVAGGDHVGRPVLIEIGDCDGVRVHPDGSAHRGLQRPVAVAEEDDDVAGRLEIFQIVGHHVGDAVAVHVGDHQRRGERSRLIALRRGAALEESAVAVAG